MKEIYNQDSVYPDVNWCEKDHSPLYLKDIDKEHLKLGNLMDKYIDDRLKLQREFVVGAWITLCWILDLARHGTPSEQIEEDSKELLKQIELDDENFDEDKEKVKDAIREVLKEFLNGV